MFIFSIDFESKNFIVKKGVSNAIVIIIAGVMIFNICLMKLTYMYRPTFWRIIKRKSVEEFQPYIYIFTCLNCICWVIYGLPVVHPDSILVVTINGVGLGITLIYLTIYCIYDHENKGRVSNCVLIHFSITQFKFQINMVMKILAVENWSWSAS